MDTDISFAAIKLLVKEPYPEMRITTSHEKKNMKNKFPFNEIISSLNYETESYKKVFSFLISISVLNTFL